jgi:hypothetical protein
MRKPVVAINLSIFSPSNERSVAAKQRKGPPKVPHGTSGTRLSFLVAGYLARDLATQAQKYEYG